MIDTEVRAAIQFELDQLAIAIEQPDADLVALEFKLMEIEAALLTAERGGRVKIEQQGNDDE